MQILNGRKKRFDKCHLSNHSYRVSIYQFFFIDRNHKLHLSIFAGVCLECKTGANFVCITNDIAKQVENLNSTNLFIEYLALEII